MRSRFIVAACALVASVCHAGSQSGQPGETRFYRSDWGQGIDPRLRLQEPAPQNITTGEISRIHGALLKVTMNRSQDFSDVANAFPNDREAYFKLGFYKWWWKTRPSDLTERTMYYGDIEMKVLR